MSSVFENCSQELQRLASWYDENAGSRNEATTRFHLIDNLFLACLGWEKSDIKVEDSHEGRFADYVFSAPRQVLVVEAKKEDTTFKLPVGKRTLVWKLTTLRQNYPDLCQALDQVASYCQKRGVPVGCVSNGHQLVAFIAVRSDGVPPMEGRSLVFDSLDSMRQNFLELWQALSKEGILEGCLSRRLLGDTVPPLPPKVSDMISGYPGHQGRNSLQTDFKILSDLIIEDISRHRDHEKQFLADTYCKSGALSQYADIAKNILATRYSSLFDDTTKSPQLVPAVTKSGITPEIISDSLSRRPVLLLGDVGVGKTMFIRNLMVSDEINLFENAVSLYIDLGEQGTLSDNLQDYVIQDMIRQLREDYDVDVDERNFVRGVYHSELQRFKKGIHADLRESNQKLFQRKELAHLEKLTSEKGNHLKLSLEHIYKARQKQVVVFLDNADQRDEKTQEAVFLIAQEFASNWPVMVFVALRPETFRKSQREGALSGYHPKAFSIEPPRVDLVVKRRLEFARQITSGKLPIAKLSDTKIEVQNLDLMISSFIYSLEANRDLIKAIDSMSAGNIRTGLDWVRQFFGSGHVDSEKIIRIQTKSGNYRVPLHEFLRAVIFGDTCYYDPNNSPVTNLLSVTSVDRCEHFLAPICLTVIRRSNNNEGWLNTDSLFDRLQSFGFRPEQINSALYKSEKRGLIETTGRRRFIQNQDPPKGVRIRTSGVYHLDYLLPLFVYVDAVVVDTPILETNWKDQIKHTEPIKSRLDRAEFFLDYLDESWGEFKAKNTGFNWMTTSKGCRADIQRVRKRLSRINYRS